ncbi:YolD-like protein [Paenibacillus uliginis N3/975]|uniref:YolD-like protein n=1 Tax=Paenibacillus uliginis N3/975 TaxID=1313296 RepID=A0A1X7HK07_9BACL|nr:YolD-like family protein [Paenibacillus uliginis]SMF88102.1 YolD-like protein [Paenibacillus uliginis N3/975]
MTTRKKLEGNGLWESSRMMLPEHKEAIICQQHEECRKGRPILDAQEIELIESALAESYNDHRRITLQLFDEYEDLQLTGIVVMVHKFRREIKLSIETDEWQWIRIEDIISAT